MDLRYFSRLDKTCRTLVKTIEKAINSEIKIEVGQSDTKVLSCVLKKNTPIIYQPKSNCFPDASIYHELLHIHRWCVDKIPRISVCESYESVNDQLHNQLKKLDVNLEHLIIVPKELVIYPNRKSYWENRINNLFEAPELTNGDILIIWAFSKHILPCSDVFEKWNAEIRKRGIDDPLGFLSEIKKSINQKQKLVKVVISRLSIPKSSVCLEYWSVSKGRWDHERMLPVSESK